MDSGTGKREEERVVQVRKRELRMKNKSYGVTTEIMKLYRPIDIV